jgi:two-component system, NarL family, nitrate/nitrite response regulator NarL
MIRVLIVGAVRLYRDGIAHALGLEDGLAVAGAAGSADEARDLIEALDPDVVLVDLAMPDGLEFVRRLTSERRRVVVLSVPDRDREILACAEAGVAGLVTRDGSFADLVAAIVSAARGELTCSPYVAALLLRRVASLVSTQPARGGHLTVREREVVTLLEERLSNKEIARRLHIEVATVKNHVHNIFEKLHIERRADVAAALRRVEHALEL